MNNKGFTTIELLIVVAVFTIIYFIGVSSVSYAFSTSETDLKYDDIINIIEVQAQTYAENNSDIFKEENTVYVYVKDLIENKYLVANENGKIMNPQEPNKDLNDLKIKIEKKEDKIETNIVEI